MPSLSIVQSNAAAKGEVSVAQQITLPNPVAAGHVLVLAAIWAVPTGGVADTTFQVTDPGAGNGANAWAADANSRKTIAATHYAEIGVQFFTAADANAATAEAVSVLPSQTVFLALALWEIPASVYFGSSNGTGTATNGGAAQSSPLTPSLNGAAGFSAIMFDDGGGVGSVGTPGTGYTFDLNGGGGSQEFGAEHIIQAVAAALTGAFTIQAGHDGPWVTGQIIFTPAPFGVAETVAISDSVSTAGARSRTAADTVSVADQAGRGALKPVADSVTLADQAQTGNQAFLYVLSETVSVADQVRANMAAATRTTQDAVTFIDQAGRGIQRSRAASNSISIVDSATDGRAGQAQDTVTFTDLASLGPLGRPRPINENVTVNESVAITVNVIAIGTPSGLPGVVLSAVPMP